MSGVLGLDLSLTATGIACPDGTLTTVKSKPDDGTVRGRTNRLQELATAIVWAHAGDVSLVVIEGPAYAQQAQAGVHLRAGLWWHVAIEAARCCPDAELLEVSPSALKKFATGRGNATKADMRMALFQRAGLDVRDDNQADAWWLRQLGLWLTGDPDRIDLPRGNVAALSKIRRP